MTCWCRTTQVKPSCFDVNKSEGVSQLQTLHRSELQRPHKSVSISVFTQSCFSHSFIGVVLELPSKWTACKYLSQSLFSKQISPKVKGKLPASRLLNMVTTWSILIHPPQLYLIQWLLLITQSSSQEFLKENKNQDITLGILIHKSRWEKK